MTQWEYRLVNLSIQSPAAGGGVPDVMQDVTAQLNVLGAMDWEAVGEVRIYVAGSVRPHEGATYAQLLMKRPVGSDNNRPG